MKDLPPGHRNYRNPPKEHQFKKGRSGNPKGRPKKNPQAGFGALGGGIANRLGAMALDEATRLVTVQEGDKVYKIPAMQALLRTLFNAAVQGDTRAARQLLELIGQAEAGRTGAALGTLEQAVRFKEKYGPIFQERERRGEEPLEIYPHPDDILIDKDSGEVTIDGPVNKEQADARKVVRAQAIQSMARYFEVEAALAEDPTNKALKKEIKELKQYYEFLAKDSARMQRHEVGRESRAALEAKPDEPNEANKAIAGPGQGKK